MIRLSFFTFVFLIGLSMVITKNDLKFRRLHQNRFSYKNEETRSLRHLMGKLVDTETNSIYAVDGHKQQEDSLPSDATTTIALLPLPIPPNAPKREEFACLAACHTCAEEYSLEHVSFRCSKTIS